MPDSNGDHLDLFSGGVPPGAVFQGDIHPLRAAISNIILDLEGLYRPIYVGVVSYFEAFCKNNFAAAVNILPSLLSQLSERGIDTRIDAARLSMLGDNALYKVGLMVSESLDFGRARKINTLYSSLLNITPFARNECVRYDAILRDRNLLVHHGGIYTLRHLVQVNEQDFSKAFMDSKVVSRDDLRGALDFLHDMAYKIVQISSQALHSRIENEKPNLGDIRKKALSLFDYWAEGL